LSNISFSISKTKAWDAVTNHYEDQEKRQADSCVFALLEHQDKSSVDPLNLDQWQFFVLPTKILNEKMGDQKSISLRRLKDLVNLTVSFPNLKQSIIENYQKSQLR
jgi:hypothetical protein